MRLGGRYQLVEHIATGGMGEVYRARLETSLEGAARDVAIKLMRAELARRPEAQKRFLDEARYSMQLHHPNVVQAVDAGRDPRFGPYLVLEWVDGVGLDCLLDRGAPGQPALSQDEALYVMREVLEGLAYAHSLGDGGLVHRDLSPSNVLVSHRGEIKLSDFGLARGGLDSASSEAGGLKGKLAYVAPEQVAGEQVDRRADLYSAGAMLYELLSGYRTVSVAHPAAAVPKIVAGEVVPLAELQPELPTQLSDLVQRALARDPTARFEHAPQMRAALPEAEPAAAQLATRVQAVMPERQAGPLRMPQALATTEAEALRWQRWAAAAVLVLGVASLVGWYGRSTELSIDARRTPHTQAAEPPRAKLRTAEAKPSDAKPTRASPPVATGAPVQVAAPSSPSKQAAAPTAKAQSKRPRTKRSTRAPAQLSINTDPWSYVSVDGKRLGSTPLMRHALPPGKHLLELSNPHTGAALRRTLTLKDGERKVLSLKLPRPAAS